MTASEVKILETTKLDDILIKFLRKQNGYYTFPVVEDVAWFPVEDVALLDPPIINARGQHFFEDV